jgi:glycosyltransferase involved in cell wall biosynthesis
MNILIAHNTYQQPGGEDQVFYAEAGLLEAYGHRVIRYQLHNDEVDRKNKISLLADTIWNRRTARELRELIHDERVNVLHAHNTFPLISPSCYYAAEREGIPVVQTLHNYRLLCPSANFYRNEAVCTDCIGRVYAWPAVKHACYRGSRSATAVTATMLAAHRFMGTWTRTISAYIALTESARSMFMEGGLPSDRIFIKPNFVQNDPGLGSGQEDFFLFAGRLTPEKGIRTLLEAWQNLGSLYSLEIIGDGPLAGLVEDALRCHSNIRWQKWLPRDQVIERMKAAKAVVVPSSWPEVFGMVVIEAFATGTPVIASTAGSLKSLVHHQRTGLQFTADHVDELAAQVRWVHDHPDGMYAMRHEARREFELKYTGERNYSDLMAIYAQVLGHKAAPEILSPGAARLSASSEPEV